MNKYFAILLAALASALLLACGGGGTPPPPAGQPVVRINAPAFGASVSEGDVVGVQATATDSTGVTRAELYVDGKLVNTKLAASASGQTELNVTLEWVATPLGTRSLVVRAFNAANASGEATLQIAVNPPLFTPTTGALGQSEPPTTVALAQTGVPPTATDTPFPTTGVLAEALPTVPVTFDEPMGILTATPNPSALPTAIVPFDPILTTPTSPPRTQPLPTVPIVFDAPFDGGMSVTAFWANEGLFVEANANDIPAGGDNGAGIAYVEFAIQDLKGKVIATKRENNVPYCFFGEQDGTCLVAKPDTSGFVWSPGVPIKAGWYFVRAVAHTPDNRIQVAEQAVRINFPPSSFENLFVNIVEPVDDRPVGELNFEAEVSGAAADAGVERVEMSVVLYNGRIVDSVTERTPRYCGFTGGNNGEPCPAYNFAGNDNKWESGVPIARTQYLLRAVVYMRDGQITATSRVIQITASTSLIPETPGHSFLRSEDLE